MPQGDIVQSKKDQRKYLLGQFLKAGLIGAVYPAESMDALHRQVAVKLPAPNLSHEDRARFRLEYDIMSGLASRMGDHLLIPSIEEGINLTSGGDLLILEFVGDQYMLSTRLAELEKSGQILEREILALRAAEQYARLLIALHSMNYTCMDRKLTDIRWREDDPSGKERLIVLDWNVVREGADGIADDLQLFGSLWYQFLAGRYPTANLNPFDDSLWRNGNVSFGTRWLLLRLLSPSPGEQYRTALEVQQAIKARLEWMTLPAGDLLSEGRPIYDRVNNQALDAESSIESARKRADADRKIPQINLGEERRSLDLIDLAWRKDPLMVGTLYKECLDLVRSQGDRLVSHIELGFRMTNYEIGEVAANWSTQIAKDTSDALLKLRVARWNVLIQAGKAAMSEGLVLRPVREKLANWLNEIEELSQQDNIPANRWASYEDQFPSVIAEAQLPDQSRTRLFLDELAGEVRFRRLLSNIADLGFQSKFDEAVSVIEQAKQLLERFHSQLWDAVRSTLPDLEKLRKALQDKKWEKEGLQEWEEMTAPRNVIGRPDYLHYLLQKRLDDARSRIGSSPSFEQTNQWLRALNELYDVASKGYWEGVIFAAQKLALTQHSDPNRVTAGRQEAVAHLKAAREAVERKLSFYH